MRNYLIIITLLILLLSACQKSNEQIQLKYLGAAGWVITDGGTKVLVDPYLSRIKLVGRSTSSKISNAAKNRDWGSDRKKYYRDDRFEPDTTIINYLINGDAIDSSAYILSTTRILITQQMYLTSR